MKKQTTARVLFIKLTDPQRLLCLTIPQERFDFVTNVFGFATLKPAIRKPASRPGEQRQLKQ
jgi:hypothetical protein